MHQQTQRQLLSKSNERCKSVITIWLSAISTWSHFQNSIQITYLLDYQHYECLQIHFQNTAHVTTLNSNRIVNAYIYIIFFYYVHLFLVLLYIWPPKFYKVQYHSRCYCNILESSAACLPGTYFCVICNFIWYLFIRTVFFCFYSRHFHLLCECTIRTTAYSMLLYLCAVTI